MRTSSVGLTGWYSSGYPVSNGTSYAEPLEGKGVDEVDVTGMQLFDVSSQHLAICETLRNVDRVTVVRRNPRLVVELKNQRQVHGE